MNFDKTFFPELIEFVNKNETSISSSHPNVYVIYLVLMMFLNKDNDKFSIKYKKYLKLNENKFSRVQFSYYYRYLESFYHSKINEGQINFRNELFEIYTIMFAKDLFILENFITDKDFNNVINIALPLGKFDWVRLYIEKYKDFIIPDLAEESYNLAMAKFFFYKEDFKNVFPHLNLIHYKDPHYYINSKILLAKVYYETGALGSLVSLLDSLRKYLTREKNLNNPQVQILKNFIKHISILAKIREGNKTDELGILKKMMENGKIFLSSKSWFVEKIVEFDSIKNR
ncbi:MAG: hypothetical protein IPL53_06325 [Ignavibacteria bacterium]|nr:hypothetical protein [Ignavibacteria bacterium]